MDTNPPQPEVQVLAQSPLLKKLFLFGLAMFLITLLLVFVYGFQTYFFYFSSLASILLLLWLIFSLFIFLLTLGLFIKLSFLARFFKIFGQIWLIVIYFGFSFFILLNIFFQFLPFGAERISNLPYVDNSVTPTPPAGGSTTPEADGTTSDAQTTCGVETLTPLLGEELLANADFDRDLDSWEKQVWFVERDDQYNQVNATGGEVDFIAPAGNPNSRAGILQTVNLNVSAVNSLILRARVKADQVVLGGTGQQGREAPIAVGVVYYDQDCVLHNALPEDPSLTTNRMFWQGFNYQAPGVYDSSIDLTTIAADEWYDYEYDLAALNPRVIVAVGAEGAGWAPRSGSVASISLIAN